MIDKILFGVGILLAALVLIGALIGTIAAYLAYCTRHPSRKLKAEVFVVGMVVLASLVIRMIIGFASLPDVSLSGGFMSFFHGLFSAVAGLTFNSLLELGDMQIITGVLACLYYGIIVYASLVFLIVITVGLSYEFYSRVQTRALRTRFKYYYIFTAITRDSLLLAEDIDKKMNCVVKGGKRVKARRAAIIFFEDGQESFSRKNSLHRKIMELGFFYYSDFRRGDKGELISFLQTFKFAKKHCEKDDRGADCNKLFYVFATGDCGGFEGDNSEVVFEDLDSVLTKYVRVEGGKAVNLIPTTVNYFLLTGGEINYESYDRRLKGILDAHIERACGGLKMSEEQREDFYNSLKTSVQVNVFNEATLSSQNFISARARNLERLGAGAFGHDNMPDVDGAYRVAVIGFGKTGQYAMEELYTHTAHLTKRGGDYLPVQFVADVYDVTCADKSGLFAYNHPLFRCMNGEGGALSPTAELIEKAGAITGEAYETLYAACKKRGVKGEKCKQFVDSRMAFPIAVFHSESCFQYPFMGADSADAAVIEAQQKNIRAFIVALGDDERNIAMANVLIDSFKRACLAGGKDKPRNHITIFVNLIEERSAVRLNWRGEEDEAVYCKPENPRLSVVPFGCRNEMFSYSTLLDDYASRLYNYGYELLTDKEHHTDEERSEFANNPVGNYAKFLKALGEKDGEGKCGKGDNWLLKTPYERHSNRAAHLFAVNYLDYGAARGGKLSDGDFEYMARLEHERWCRYYISHGWTYADYNKAEKAMRREMRQHTCLCPYDIVLDEYTKEYDRGNVRLGLIGAVVYGGEGVNG